jgi:hypothetical protein
MMICSSSAFATKSFSFFFAVFSASERAASAFFLPDNSDDRFDSLSFNCFVSAASLTTRSCCIAAVSDVRGLLLISSFCFSSCVRSALTSLFSSVTCAARSGWLACRFIVSCTSS